MSTLDARDVFLTRSSDAKVLGCGVLSGRALAVVVLGWAMLRATVKRLFGAVTGLRLFHENYGRERLLPVDRETREAMGAFSRCIGCARCDVGEAERVAASRGAYPGLMRFVLASSRSMPDYDAAALAIAHVPPDVLRAKESLCPTGVPFVALGHFVQTKARRARRPGPPDPNVTANVLAVAAKLPLATGSRVGE